MKRIQKILGIVILVALVAVITFVLVETAPNMMASVGWHGGTASVGWVTFG